MIVIKDSDNNLRVSSKIPLSIGDVLETEEGERIIVREEGEEPLIQTWGNVREGQRLKQVNWELLFNRTTIFIPSQFFGQEGECEMRAPCLVPKGHRGGLLGWTLYYDETSIVYGNDYETPGVCYFRHKGKFKPGVYTLEVRLFHHPKMLYVSEQLKEWVLSEPSSLLYCNQYELIM